MNGHTFPFLSNPHPSKRKCYFYWDSQEFLASHAHRSHFGLRDLIYQRWRQLFCLFWRLSWNCVRWWSIQLKKNLFAAVVLTLQELLLFSRQVNPPKCFHMAIFPATTFKQNQTTISPFLQWHKGFDRKAFLTLLQKLPNVLPERKD